MKIEINKRNLSQFVAGTVHEVSPSGAEIDKASKSFSSENPPQIVFKSVGYA